VRITRIRGYKQSYQGSYQGMPSGMPPERRRQRVFRRRNFESNFAPQAPHY